MLIQEMMHVHFAKVPHARADAPFEVSRWRVSEAASALFRGDHRCLSLMIVDAPGVSLINRQSQLINNWTPLAVLHLQGFAGVAPRHLGFEWRCPA